MFPDVNDFNKKAIKFVMSKGFSGKDYKDMLESKVFNMKSDKLRKMDYSLLNELAKYYKLYLISDSPKIYINFYLDDFKIDKNVFELIISNPFLEYDITKVPCMNECLKNAQVLASEALMVGDNYEIDILPAEKLGLNAAYVRSVEDTEALVKKLIEIKQKV